MNSRIIYLTQAFIFGQKSCSRIFFTILLVLLFIEVDVSAEIDSVKANKINILRNDLNSLLANPDFSNSHIGICVQSVQSGEIIYAQNEYRNFIPASTQKIITTSAALELLGKNFKFSTKIYLDGIIAPNGEFTGNIIIRGSGDPTISKYYYKEPLEIIDSWVEKLDSLGINSIKGNIVGDDEYFDKIYYGPGWSWDDFPYFYSSQVSALSINDNRVDVFVYSGDSIGDYAKISSYPYSSYYRVMNNVKTGKTTDEQIFNISRETTGNILSISGTIPYDPSGKKNHALSVTIDNPAMFFLNLFRQKLEQHKILFSGGLLTKSEIHEKIDYTVLNPIIEYYSPNITEIVTVINQESHNLAAEMLLKTLGKEYLGHGTFSSGTEYLKSFLDKSGVNIQNIRLYDGSGLSRLNLISPNNLVTLLNWIYRSSHSDVFIKSLASPGEPGTLKRRMTRSKAEKNVTAKTGSMNNISSICGYVTTSDNEVLSFAVMMQNFTVPPALANNLQDLILMRLASFSR
ncbi:MAG: D-alanyl-D-alanine carboxypeptidase/D-alanyl-D-alanine-endopeptidase [Candidatus Kapaibacterium sp.]